MTVSLDGTYQTISDEKDVYSSPYSLRVMFFRDMSDGCSVNLDDVFLINKINGDVLLSRSMLFKELAWSDILEREMASFLFEPIEIPFDDYIVEVRGSLIKCEEVSFNESIELVREFEEEDVTFWDVLMGI